MHFEKISIAEWKKWFARHLPLVSEDEIMSLYENIHLPMPGSKYAAGQDFYCPINITLEPGKIMTIPTGIRWVTEADERNKFLAIVPRSGLGCKYGLRLRNTVGIIDSDYCLADNEGHIMAVVEVSDIYYLIAGDRFMQGIVVPFERCGEDNNNMRSGGFGSTGVK